MGDTEWVFSGKRLNKIMVNHERVVNWESVEIDGSTIQVYYKPRAITEGKYVVKGSHYNGFDFYITEDNSSWVDDDGVKVQEVDCLFHGIAYFDGVRHLYMDENSKEDDFGYHHYPYLQHYPKIFEELNRLVGKYCNKDEV